MSESRSLEKSKLIFVLHVFMDSLLVCLGFSLVYYYQTFIGKTIRFDAEQYMRTVLVIFFSTLLFFQIYGVFRCGRRPYKEIILSAMLSLIFVNLICIALVSLFKVFDFSVILFLWGFILQFTTIVLWKYVVYRIYPVFYKPKTAAFIGNGEETYKVAQKVLKNDKSMFEVKYIAEYVDNNTFKQIGEVDVVFLSPNLEPYLKEAIVYHCMGLGKTVYIIPELFEIAMFNATMSRFDDIPAFRIDNLNLSLEQLFLKRTFDIIVSLVLIVISSPLMLFAFVGTKLFDRGPVLFSQERVTRWGRKFNLYKFRTMVVDAEKNTGPVLATDKDNRVTKIGSFLRSTRIDELPQFFNVLFGDMSIVGPRPERQFFIDQFVKDIPEFEYRLTVKAGITGLAQVLGKYTTLPEDKLRFDLFYIRNYSFLLDMKIIFQTVKIMFMKVSSQGIKEEKVPSFVKKEFKEVLNKNL
ncbi:MAG: sugar transferase [Clostridia bacterium]|nr:sugar transferase [Clostridia bacterium]